MIALASLLKHRATWGVGIAIGVFVAIAAHGRLKYTDGKRDGIAEARAVAAADLAVARAAGDAQIAAGAAAATALRDTIGTLRGRVAVLSEEAALAKGNYRAALVAYEREKSGRDSSVAITPEQAACDELARACAVAAQTAQAERDTLALTLRAAERIAAVQDSVIRTEPARTSLALRESLAAQRATFPKPNRIGWFALGGVVGAVLGALR